MNATHIQLLQCLELNEPTVCVSRCVHLLCLIVFVVAAVVFVQLATYRCALLECNCAPGLDLEKEIFRANIVAIACCCVRLF